jgi:hypothetical protein
MQGFEAFAQETLLQGFSVPSSAHDRLQAAEAKLAPPVVRQASDDSGASGDQRVWLCYNDTPAYWTTTVSPLHHPCQRTLCICLKQWQRTKLTADCEVAGPEADGA